MGQSISFIHLSDIHFRKSSGDKFDIDHDLRHEIIRDISRNAKMHLQNVKGILVCGDIAFSAKEEEYEKAQEFLKEICKPLSLSETAVYCVPGNHDVDQSIPYRGSVLHSLQGELEKVNNSNEIDAKLGGYFRDQSSDEILFKHIETYNTKFAGKYGCNINTEQPNWQVDFNLEDNTVLRVYGLNSVVISNSDDHKEKLNDKPMIMGRYQIPESEDGVVYMSLCHHPPECWKDPNSDVQKLMNKRVCIQLYGHKHVQEIKEIDHSLIVGSGATHPSRFEDGWKPRYNWIKINIVKEECKTYLKIEIYQRVLSSDGDEFIADNEECKKYSIKLEDNHIVENLISDTITDDVNVKSENKEILVKQIDVDNRIIVYEFLELSFIIQTMILSKFRLLNEDDQGKKYVNIIDKIIDKARENNCLNEFWNEIKKYT